MHRRPPTLIVLLALAIVAVLFFHTESGYALPTSNLAKRGPLRKDFLVCPTGLGKGEMRSLDWMTDDGCEVLQYKVYVDGQWNGKYQDCCCQVGQQVYSSPDYTTCFSLTVRVIVTTWLCSHERPGDIYICKEGDPGATRIDCDKNTGQCWNA
ncbi:hypothetical protein M427DRAFT_158247 [Gonapodya prolifera JEL478]|uniref:Uncharacterized protein n=1 Tax=Gonapodya prolifera (strain JEL478) TaxID=1344416 RepID=A0A139A418_GONPJ|nr:hypothetical protein M427DRAFT_158247 [Gonapodya prolifera JEL478]|eukprot:KXS11338.1 hypothetical protein M427DRAFT_158247 [Gonapodya prolifera JEL478]